MEERISAQELAEWGDFYGLEPFGWDAQCYTAGIVAATIANIHRDTKQKREPYAALDFVPGAEPKKKDPRLAQAELGALFAQMKAAQEGLSANKNPGRQSARQTPKRLRSRDRKRRGL